MTRTFLTIQSFGSCRPPCSLSWNSTGSAAAVAATGKLVLFGIKPNEPHTGYGYIRRGQSLAGATGQAFGVDAFFEKPDRATAQRYLDAGSYYWNSGIFVLHAGTFLDELYTTCTYFTYSPASSSIDRQSTVH